MSSGPAETGTRPVIIVGGGIAGVAAALAFSRKGRRVLLLEQADSFGEIGAGIQLGPNAFKRFDALGLTEAIERVAVFPDNLIMRDALSGEEITRVPLGASFRSRFNGPYAVIHRADLHAVLVDAARRQSHMIALETSKKMTGFTDHGSHVSVATADGMTYSGSALIGADGLWSSLRERIVGDGKPRVSGHIAYRAVLPIEQVPPDLRSASVILWAGPKTHLVHYPLRRGELFNLVAVFHSDRYEEGWNTAGDPAELHERFRGQRQEVLTLLAKIDEWRMWVLCDREPVKEWSKGRVTLIGDAAHPMLQYLAQGAGMALEDAVCLADEAEKVGDDYERAFLAFQNARYLRTGRVQVTARIYGEVYHAAGVTRELRNIELASRSTAQAGEGMAWLYDG